MTIEHVSVNDGKYTVVLEDGNMHALRYGEPWGRDLAGDNLVELAEARAKVIEAKNDSYESGYNDGRGGRAYRGEA
jgi:hypothetical protein